MSHKALCMWLFLYVLVTMGGMFSYTAYIFNKREKSTHK